MAQSYLKDVAVECAFHQQRLPLSIMERLEPMNITRADKSSKGIGVGVDAEEMGWGREIGTRDLIGIGPEDLWSNTDLHQ